MRNKNNSGITDNIVDAKNLRDKLNAKTEGLIKKSDQLMNKADKRADSILVKSKGKARKTINKV